MVVIKKIFIYIFFFLLIFCKYSNASKILDYETEIFLKSLINEVAKANDINRNIRFVVLANNNVNAFVDQNSIIYITSGLIENCNDYVALLTVIAHEIGHIDNNHIKQRKIGLEKINNINSISNLSIIAGSLISKNPEMLQSLALSSAATSDYFINFSKDQEREADYYALNTLKELNLYSTSIIDLLKTIEKKSLSKGITKDKLKISTHPYFEERIDIIKYLNEKNNSNFDFETNNKFKFIRAKFLGYSANLEKIHELEDIYKRYATSILTAKNGDLKFSMEELNKLIKKYDKNIFLYETKADILYSFGYINESIRFYKKVIDKYNDNYYAQIRIFENTEIEKLTHYEAEKLFVENFNLINNFYNNKNILLTYLRLSEYNDKTEWINFLNYWINKDINNSNIKENLSKFKKVEDKNLSKLIELIYQNII